MIPAQSVTDQNTPQLMYLYLFLEFQLEYKKYNKKIHNLGHFRPVQHIAFLPFAEPWQLDQTVLYLRNVHLNPLEYLP